MKKIPCLFKRKFKNGQQPVTQEINPLCQWVINGEGYATREYDGTCCLVRSNMLYKRYTLRPGGKAPVGFTPATEVDSITGKQEGWLPLDQYDYFHVEAWNELVKIGAEIKDGTYELCGPKVNENKERLLSHVLIKHGNYICSDAPRTYDKLKDYLSQVDMKGLVFYHEDGRMAKIRKSDFGIKR